MSDTGNNPGGAGYGNYITTGAVLQQYIAGVALPIGSVVDLDLYAGPGTHNPPTPPELALSATTATGRTIGVVVGGDVDGTGTVRAGATAVVLIAGVGRVLADATTVAGDALVQSPATQGAVQTAATPSSRTIGIALQAVTVSSGTDLVWALILPGTNGGTGGGGGGGTVDTIVAGTDIAVDATDPANPIVSFTGEPGDFPTLSGAGSPYGVTIGEPGQTYQDTNTGALYLYAELTAGENGWTIVAGAAVDANSCPGLATIPGDINDSLALFSNGDISIGATGQAQMTGTSLVDLEVANAALSLSAGGVTKLNADTDQDLELTVDGGSFTLTITSDGMATDPPSSAVTTSGLAALAIGTDLQNTLDYDVMYCVVIPVTASTGGSLVMGVGPSAGPSTDPATPALAGADHITLTGILPAGYYLHIGTSGTITCGTPVATYTGI